MVVGKETTAQQLAKYITQVDYEHLPDEVIRKTKGLVLDQLGVQLIGSTLSWNRIIYDFVTGFHVQGESIIVNYGIKALAHDAAFVNGAFGQGCELDDVFDRGGSHPGSASVPVALALGEKNHIDGKTFLLSLVVGYDTGYHVGRGMYPGIKHRGFHSQNVFGLFNATAVAGKILKLDATQMAHALAIAGSQASGTMEYDQSGGEVKRMHTSLAARGGIQSATLAKMGLTGPLTIFEGKRGILLLFSGEINAGAVTQDLGREFGVMHSALKRYPVVVTLQTSIDVLSSLMKEHGLKAKDVERIDVGLNEASLLHGASIYEPQDTISAQFSLAFSLAIRLLKGSNDLSLYLDPQLWRNPQVLELAHKVHPYAVAEAKGEEIFASRMRVTLVSGQTVEGRLDNQKGSPKNPMTAEECHEKFRNLASSVLPKDRIEEVIRIVDDLEQLQDVASLASLLVRAK